MTPLQHLERIYAAARLAGLNAETHDVIRQSAEALAKYIQDKEKPIPFASGMSEAT